MEHFKILIIFDSQQNLSNISMQGTLEHNRVSQLWMFLVKVLVCVGADNYEVKTHTHEDL